MMALWDHYWPAIIAAIVVGLIAGVIAFRSAVRKKRTITLLVGIAAVLGLGAMWHGPGGAGEFFAYEVEDRAATTLSYYEMTQVQAKLQRDPLTRTLVLSGPADDFQRDELVRIMDELPGVAKARWVNSRPASVLPLLAEAGLAALVGFGLGLLLAYLIELRRRSRAEWSW
jgi:hypothetical protein